MKRTKKKNKKQIVKKYEKWKLVETKRENVIQQSVGKRKGKTSTTSV